MIKPKDDLKQFVINRGFYMTSKPSRKTAIPFIISALLVIITVIVLSVVFMNNGDITSTVMTSGVFILLVIMFVYLCVLFFSSMKISVYQYRNIIFLTSIFYIFIQLISLFVFMLKCISNGMPPSISSFVNIIADLPSQFSYWAIPVFIVISLSITVSNLFLIIHEGFRPKNLLGILFGVIYVGGTFLIYFVFEKLYDLILEGMNSFQPAVIAYSIFQLFVLLSLCYFECIFFGFCVLSLIAVRKVPAYDKDYIIILGCSISKQGGLLPLLKGRTNKAIRFAWDQEINTGKPVKYIPSGGQGPDEIMSEGSAMEMYLLSHGAEQDEIIAEKNSKNTYENFKFSKSLVNNKNDSEKIRFAFATTNFHVFRSGLIARNAGLDAEGIASKTKWYFWPNGFLREFFAILAMNKKGHLLALIINLLICVMIYIASIA